MQQIARKFFFHFTGIVIFAIGLHLIIQSKKKSFDEFKEAYISLSSHQRMLCLKSEVSNQTLLFRYVCYIIVHFNIRIFLQGM